MSDIVKQIREGFESTITTTLPTFSLLDHKFDLEKNNFRNNDQRFGVLVEGGANAIPILKHYTIGRSFVVRLAQGYNAKQKNDTLQQAAQDTLEDAIDEISKAAITTKLGLPSIVLDVTIINISPPEFDIEHLASIDVEYIIKYRNRLN